MHKWRTAANHTHTHTHTHTQAILHEITVVRPLNPHLNNHPGKMNKTCWTLLEKQRRTHKWCSSMDPFSWNYSRWMNEKKLLISYLCWCCLEDLAERWMIGSNGKFKRSVLSARLDDDDDDDILVWFSLISLFNGLSPFVGYLIPKLSFLKNNGGSI